MAALDVVCGSVDALIEHMFVTVATLIPLTRVRPSTRYYLTSTPLPMAPAFVDLVVRSCPMPSTVLVFALIYLARLASQLPPRACGNQDTPHRLFLSSVLVSSKYLCEDGTHLTSSTIAESAAPWYSSEDINRMEASLLHMLHHNLWVSPCEIQEFVAKHGHKLQLTLRRRKTTNAVIDALPVNADASSSSAATESRQRRRHRQRENRQYQRTHHHRHHQAPPQLVLTTPNAIDDDTDLGLAQLFLLEPTVTA
ncbi:hypothetical protein BC940DRAFT_253873 [Gongronella butleri]|nr:hypothetical protein BC940DRAFT_253873 [Gongronella butleri]